MVWLNECRAYAQGIKVQEPSSQKLEGFLLLIN